MATSVTQGFNELRDRFPLTETQTEGAQTKVRDIRAFFGAEFTMAQPATAVGSYARGSIIRIERDIDIIAPLHYLTYKAAYDDRPQAFLYMVRDALNERFGSTTVSSKKVAVKLEFSTIAVDVVPCFPRQGGGYMMSNGVGGWMGTNPPFHTEFMAQANLAHDAKLRALVKLMKFWNITNGHHLSSLHVELMTERMWKNVGFGERLYSELVSESLKCMPGWAGSLFADPWEAGRAIDANLARDERAQAVRMLKEDAENAAQAESYRKSGEVKKAFERWSVVFRREFPVYG